MTALPSPSAAAVAAMRSRSSREGHRARIGGDVRAGRTTPGRCSRRSARRTTASARCSPSARIRAGAASSSRGSRATAATSSTSRRAPGSSRRRCSTRGLPRHRASTRAPRCSRARRERFGGRVELVEASAEALPFADASFDHLTVHLPPALRRRPRGDARASSPASSGPGGTIAMLEFGLPRGRLAPGLGCSGSASACRSPGGCSSPRLARGRPLPRARRSARSTRAYPEPRAARRSGARRGSPTSARRRLSLGGGLVVWGRRDAALATRRRPRGPRSTRSGPGGWRDYVTLLHLPYTAWHLSYVVVGALPRAARPLVDARADRARVRARDGRRRARARRARRPAAREPRSPRACSSRSRSSRSAPRRRSASRSLSSGRSGSSRSSRSASCSCPPTTSSCFGGRVHTDLGFALAWGAFPARDRVRRADRGVPRGDRARGGLGDAAVARPAPALDADPPRSPRASSRVEGHARARGRTARAARPSGAHRGARDGAQAARPRRPSSPRLRSWRSGSELVALAARLRRRPAARPPRPPRARGSACARRRRSSPSHRSAARATPNLATLRAAASPARSSAARRAATTRRSCLYSPRFDDVRPLAVVYATSAADVIADDPLGAAERRPDRRPQRRPQLRRLFDDERGVVIDVSRLDAVVVDAAHGTARIGAGARLMDVYAKLAPHGVTIPAGSCPTVGIAGLALGGGIGFASPQARADLRQHRLADDRHRRRRRPHRASRTRNADLLWACKGGGGGQLRRRHRRSRSGRIRWGRWRPTARRGTGRDAATRASRLAGVGAERARRAVLDDGAHRDRLRPDADRLAGPVLRDAAQLERRAPARSSRPQDSRRRSSSRRIPTSTRCSCGRTARRRRTAASATASRALDLRGEVRPLRRRAASGRHRRRR